MPAFSNRLNYTFGNEDCKTESKALNIQPEDRVVCVTASGDRPLNLLLNECNEMIAVDINPLQNNLLHLKAAAMSELPFQEYIDFLEGNSQAKISEKLNLLKEIYSPEVQEFWQERINDLSKGILYQGVVEKWTKWFAFFIKLFRKRKLQQLFAFDNIENQKEFIENEWDVPAWRKTFQVAFNPVLTKFFLIKDPGLHDHVDPNLNIGLYIYERMNKSLQKELASHNVLCSLILQGKVHPQGYPPYLTEKGTSIIRTRLSKLKIVTSNIIDFLETQDESSLDAFSISDVASYINAEDFGRLVAAIVRTAKPGARFCMRQFLSNQQIPHEFKNNIQRNHALEKELEEEDRCFVYRFMTGSIQK